MATGRSSGRRAPAGVGYPCAGDLWRHGAAAGDCPRPAQLAVVDRVRSPGAAILVVLFACPKHLRDVQLWVDRHHPRPAGATPAAVTVPARRGAAALRRARAAGARWEVLTNLGRPAGSGAAG